MSDSKCDAPCIINVASGFYLVLCGGDLGHNGDHSYEIPDTNDTVIATVEWSYTGTTSEDANGISYAPPMSTRCNSLVRTKRLPKLDSRDAGVNYYQPVLSLARSDGCYANFVCEKNPEHNEGHMRSGIFGPLGMKWRITW